MLTKGPDKQWELVGDQEPYFGVLTDAQFERRNLDDQALSRFFDSGEQHIDRVVSIVKRHVNPDFKPTRCLDFGCGVGRLVVPMARRFHRVVGVDVAQSMLEEAKRNATKYGVENVEFLQSDDNLSRLSEKFDFIHSYIVFQHIPRERGMKILSRLLDLLDVDGVAALHFTYDWNVSPLRKLIHWSQRSLPFVHNLSNLLKGRRFDQPRIYMNHYSLNQILNVLQARGFGEVHLIPTNDLGHLGVILFFRREAPRRNTSK